MEAITQSQPVVRYDFESVVGSDLFRAKAIIRSRLPKYTRVRFRVEPYFFGRKPRNVEPAGLNEIILWHDVKWDAVASTPVFRGFLPREHSDELEEGSDWWNESDGSSYRS